MFCHYQYYREWHTDKLQSAVAHSDEKYQCKEIFDYSNYFDKNIELNLPKRKKIQKDQCKEMSDCPYTGTNILQKREWSEMIR